MKRLIIATILALALGSGGVAKAQSWHGFKSCSAFSNTNPFTAPGLGTQWQPYTEVSGAPPEICLDNSGHAYVFAKKTTGAVEYRWIDTHGVYGWVGSLGYYPTFTSCGAWPYHTLWSYYPYGSYTPYTSVTGVAPTYCVADYGTIWVMAQEYGTGAYKWVMTDDVFGIGN